MKIIYILKKLILLVLFSVVLSQPDEQVVGYLRQVDMSICMDECGQYFIEHEYQDGPPLAWIIFSDEFANIHLYIDRFIEVELGEVITCTECNAYEVESISLSDDCMFPALCVADPCDIAPECQINTPTECISNHCGGCYADFYDLNGNHIDCYNFIEECIEEDCGPPLMLPNYLCPDGITIAGPGDCIEDETGNCYWDIIECPIEECEDLSGLDFGACTMVLGIGYVNGECSYVSGCGWQIDGIDYSDAFFGSMDECNEQCDNTVSCDEIEAQYNSLHSGNYVGCEYDIDCMPVWGHCGDGLGNCHYAVNYLYQELEVNHLVNLWIQNQCMQWVCTCLELPYAVCNGGSCELAYCSEPNPAGCSQTGCPQGYECGYDPNDCTASSCYCDEDYDFWGCTEDCGGGTCIFIQPSGDINDDSEVNVLDIIFLVSFILMSSNPTESEFNAGDFNTDGQLNVLDVVAIVQMILNPAELPEECYIEPEVGPCDGICPTYFFNQNTNTCEEYITGCCGVEAFNSIEECQFFCE